MIYNIRELNYDDYNSFLILINDFRETSFTKEEFSTNLKKINMNGKIIVIEQNSELIATGTLIIEQKYIFNCAKLAHIEDVCVKKEFRAQGFGKKLVQNIIQEARKEGCYKITLDCSDLNSSFYKTTGFEIRGHQMSQLL